MVSTYSAADTARAISRMLRKAGFQMCVKHDRYHWSEGFNVHRVGCSSSVSVDWHYDLHLSGDALKAAQVIRREQVGKVRTFLEAKGYKFDNIGWVICERE